MIQGSAIESSRLLKRITDASGGQVWYPDSTAELKIISPGAQGRQSQSSIWLYGDRKLTQMLRHRFTQRVKGS